MFDRFSQKLIDDSSAALQDKADAEKEKEDALQKASDAERERDDAIQQQDAALQKLIAAEKERDISMQQTAAAEQDKEAALRRLECPICFEHNYRDVYAFVPCGHKICSSCKDIYPEAQPCPQCQVKIIFRLKLR
jgi:hypothetical protein